MAPAMATDKPDRQVASAGCTRCGHRPLHHITSMPRRFDQVSAFAILHCYACGHVHWQRQPEPPPVLGPA